MREVFITDLVKETLGPKNGIFESVTGDSPLNTYITGVLSPRMESLNQVEGKVDDDASLPTNEVSGIFEEDQDDASVDVPPVFSPTLDPKSRSNTMGLSFIVTSNSRPEADICLSWARYMPAYKEGGTRSWKRVPRFSIQHLDLSKSDSMTCNNQHVGDVSVQGENEGEVELSLVSRRLTDNSFFITIHLINTLSVEKDEIAETPHHIFQPQIRVLLSAETRLSEGLKRTTRNQEDELFSLMYQHDPVYVRGHMCSALWRDIDPETGIEEPLQLDHPQCAFSPPFKWIDGDILPVVDRDRFSKADVRTEFIPIYSMAMPVFTWNSEFGGSPELDAERLSESFDPKQLEKALKPFVTGYERWIDVLVEKSKQMNPSQKDISEKVVAECRTVLQRISDGINLLLNEDEARLCFCFANKAMNVQSNWFPRRRNLRWHPFQLAFILTTLESIANPESKFRNTCDLLWVPTGGGKTEAYLGIMAFIISYRRIRSLKNKVTDMTGAGISVITRYTLRLLTIQQFRRTLSLVTACEFLRVTGLDSKSGQIGWRPSSYNNDSNFLWGSTQFGIGLWVGGEVTPNKLETIFVIENGRQIPRPGALDILKNKNRSKSASGEPAQILRCPACETILAIPDMGLQPGEHTIHITVRSNEPKINAKVELIKDVNVGNINIRKVECFKNSGEYYTISATLASRYSISSDNVDEAWEVIDGKLKEYQCPIEIQCARPSRPGYFLRSYMNERNRTVDFDFNLYCPNPYVKGNEMCPLKQQWCAGAPMGLVHGTRPDVNAVPKEIYNTALPDRNLLVHILDPFQYSSQFVSDRIPIPAFTVDEQIYRWLPTIVVATADKFARFPYEPLCASLIGNIDHYHCLHGYYRKFQHTSNDKKEHPSPQGRDGNQNFRELFSIKPPDLIIQDELHLIDGPLGSLAGLYETAVDFLCTRKNPIKYISSTATIKRAEEQIGALFARRLQLFPPHGLSIRDRFFVTEKGTRFLDDDPPGRLYMGICCPGRGPLTPIVRIWSRLLQSAYENRNSSKADRFWTLTGYFNSVRELAGARALYRQDIPQQLDKEFGSRSRRNLRDENAIELSSRINSTDLPSILDILNRRFPEAEAVDTLFTTSMFGTGVDISRLGLMVINGQPKTTSSYIQASGRVGRNNGSLVVVFYRATRPRDLSHYEFFGGYHHQLHKYVEPVTVYPFAAGVLDRALGPVAVSILRNMRDSSVSWDRDTAAPYMATNRNTAGEVRNLPSIFETRSQNQPILRRPIQGDVEDDAKRKLDMWHSIASLHRDLKYVEYVISREAQFPVVLGDDYHMHARKNIVYSNAPQSLRDVEETTGFET